MGFDMAYQQLVAMVRMRPVLAITSVLLAGLPTLVAAEPVAKAPVAAPVPALLWDGIYAGGHFGTGNASYGPGTNPLPAQGEILPGSPTGLISGFQVGINKHFGNGIVLGIEANATFPGAEDRAKLTPAPFNTAIDYVGMLRGRVGADFGRFMPYAAAGLAWGHSHVNINASDGGDPVATPGAYQAGWTAGLGIEWAVGGNWSVIAEYDHVELAGRRFDLSDHGLATLAVAPRLDLVKAGLNYHFGGVDGPIRPFALPDASDVWNIHAQTTLQPQLYGPIRSPYASPLSIPGGGETRQTWTTTAFVGLRLWQGGEFYFDGETAQGFGINGTQGIAGFPSGEAQKAGADYPRTRAQRYYLKQTFGFGGGEEEVADGPNQLAGKRDIDRVTVILGRFAVGDFFDNNAYAHDPRADFSNWALWEAGAFDFPADLPGYTRGAVVELNRKAWAVRAGLVQLPAAPNSDVLSSRGGAGLFEFEERHSLLQQPGKLRLGAFLNNGNTASYGEVLAQAQASPADDINAITDANRRLRPKYGYYVNLEQQIVTDVGLFARWSWNDGHSEALSFSDIDRSIAGGVQVKGSFWGRAEDTIGLGGAVNGLSQTHRDFLAAGGYGLVIGDGRLNYRPERALEAYYAYALNKTITLTADYQLIVNPAYNADRGPASIFSGRLHAEF